MPTKNVLREWEDCINTGDLKGVLDCYSEKAVLWGTFSTIVRDHRDLIEEYFVELFQKEELKVEFTSMIQQEVRGITLLIGAYQFSYTENGPVVLPSRYSFAVAKGESGDYKILHHHSSLMPD